MYFIVPSATKQTFLMFAVGNKKGCSTFFYLARGKRDKKG